jgi:hypothetical protein
MTISGVALSPAGAILTFDILLRSQEWTPQTGK